MRHDESRRQQACVQWFRLQYRDYAILLCAIPNGGRRDKITGAIMKAEGVVAGAADLVLFVPSKGLHGLCIEMKTATGRQSAAQRQWQRAIEAQGYGYVVCRSFDEFRRVIDAYLKPVPFELLDGFQK